MFEYFISKTVKLHLVAVSVWSSVYNRHYYCTGLELVMSLILILNIVFFSKSNRTLTIIFFRIFSHTHCLLLNLIKLEIWESLFLTICHNCSNNGCYFKWNFPFSFQMICILSLYPTTSGLLLCNNILLQFD